jgi:hypothetical protein
VETNPHCREQRVEGVFGIADWILRTNHQEINARPNPKYPNGCTARQNAVQKPNASDAVTYHTVLLFYFDATRFKSLYPKGARQRHRADTETAVGAIIGPCKSYSYNVARDAAANDRKPPIH